MTETTTEKQMGKYLVIREAQFWTGSAWSNEYMEGLVFQNFSQARREARSCGGEVLYISRFDRPYRPCPSLTEIKNKIQALIKM